jgi:predicted nucleotidyltransferase
MRSPAPAIAPLFRSPLQLAVLGELFTSATEPLSVTALAARIRRGQPAVSREVRRLQEAGIVSVTPIGRTRLVEANTSLPWYRELRALLVQTIGPAALLADALREAGGIDEAFVFGSWAARFHGEPGSFPRDLDLLVIGSPDMDALNRAVRDVERRLHLDVNPVVVDAGEWSTASSDSFVGEVRTSPLVSLQLRSKAEE